MSYIDNTRRNFSSSFELTVCLTKEECKILLPFFQKIHKELQAKYEKYKDIQEGGEATERQQNLLFKYENEAEKIDNVLSSIKDIFKIRGKTLFNHKFIFKRLKLISPFCV